MHKPSTIAIVGTGLIGGSLGLAIKRRKLAAKVIGVSRTKKSVITARRIGAIDAGSQDLGAISDADMVIVCLPVKEILKQAAQIVKTVRRDCIICDAGSTKEEITKTFARLTGRFIGAHPLAGSEKNGVGNASGDLFDGSLCIVTPGKGTDRQAVAAIKGFWSRICAKVITMTPREHDREMAFVSHLPHATAYALVNAVPGGSMRYAARGFKDTTRLSCSDETIWESIFLTNRRFMIASIGRLEESLRLIKNAIRRNNAPALHALLAHAKAKRRGLGK